MSLVITLDQLREAGACEDAVRQVAEHCPDGVPVTRETLRGLRSVGVDVIYGAVLMMAPGECREFTLFTLRQRQPHIVAIFGCAGLAEHAAAIADIDWSDLAAAERILAAAVAAARAAAWDAAVVAARDAAVAAARAAAWDAAWAAARVAARDAAVDEQIDWIVGLAERRVQAVPA